MKNDLVKIELDDRREAAIRTALSIIEHSKKSEGYLSGETITKIIMEEFKGFRK